MQTPSARALPDPIREVQASLPELIFRDQRRLQRRLDGVRRIRDPLKRELAGEELVAELAGAQERLARRRAAVPVITYPAGLPVSEKREDIAAAIRDHQVVIVAGETGSGKTTQIPKICLELGRGVQGLIGHTQPRRLAARTVADRIAEELGTELGGTVGYKVRFTDQVSDRSLIKLMTDGILLAELQQDRMLHQYDTLIIDEAHERSLNIDFILGYLRRLLPRRPDLKVIITSATIDPHRFARHFGGLTGAAGTGSGDGSGDGHSSGDGDGSGGPPVVEVSGRTYPVEVRYRPLVEVTEETEDGDNVRDQVQAIGDAVEEAGRRGAGRHPGLPQR